MSPFILENQSFEINYLFILLIFFIGTSFGSFSKAFADGYVNGQKILRRSECNSCKKQLLWHHLIPIFSFIYLKGRCSFCKLKINLDTLFFEIFFGFLFLVLFIYFDSVNAIKFSLYSIFLGVIFETDRKQLAIHIPSLIIVLAISFFFALFQNFNFRIIFDLILLFAFGWSVIFIISSIYFLLRGVQGFGSGDKWLLGSISTIFDYQGILYIFLISSMLASLVGISILIKNKKLLNFKIPFGSYLCFVSIIYFFI